MQHFFTLIKKNLILISKEVTVEEEEWDSLDEDEWEPLHPEVVKSEDDFDDDI